MNFCTYYGVNSIAQAALASFSKTIKTFLDIDEKRSLVCCISFGIGVLNDPVNNFRTERGTIDEVLNVRLNLFFLANFLILISLFELHLLSIFLYILS